MDSQQINKLIKMKQKAKFQQYAKKKEKNLE